MNAFAPVIRRLRHAVAMVSLLLMAPPQMAHGAAANAWHIPWSAGGEACLGGITMRNPNFEIGATSIVYIYSGAQVMGGGGANQTGGTLWFKAATNVVWSSKDLGLDSNCGNNQYWTNAIDMAAFAPTDVIQYYLELTFDTPGVSTTYLYGADALSSVSTNRTDAEANPHSFRNRAAFIYHANDRVVIGQDVEFRAKVGYITQSETEWVDNGRLYYTIDGAEPDGSLGVPGNASTMIATMVFDNIVMDFSIAGEGMEFSTAVTNLPEFDTVKYKMGFWHSDNNEEKFADYRAATNNATFSFSLATPGDPVLTVEGNNAEYTTTKYFIDENDHETVQVSVTYDLSSVPNVDTNTVEVFSNLDRRQYVDNDWNTNGVPDGIQPPNFNEVTLANYTNHGGSYYRPYTMTDQGGDIYTLTLTASNCGAYRLTARYRTNGAAASDWEWYPPHFPEAQQAARAHAVVISPRKALEMTLYELNTLSTEATAPNFDGRSTFDDLLGAPVDSDGFDPFNLDYLNKLQVNCLWFQPIHPNGDARMERENGTDPCTGSGPFFDPGSPYATKNYFSVLAQMGDGNTEADALAEFTNFVAACDGYTGDVGTINVMLDFVANHTSWDAVFGQGAVDIGVHTNIDNTNSALVAASDPIGSYRPYWYADDNGGDPNYCDEADFYNDPCDNDWTAAPDRGDFGQWLDVAELYFGRYSALVCLNPEDNNNYKNETDAVDYIGSMTPGVIEIWKYFGYYPEFWIRQTGHPGVNTGDPAQDALGIDALRCDFGQGLPPQCWEYVINRTRNIKWNMVFMAETLDGGIPGYRSNRHFDILNENLVFQFTQAKINDSQQLVTSLESRRSAYSGGAILLNQTSHDEVMPDDDPWVTAARFASVSSVAGLPMIFYGQENGIGLFEEGDPDAAKDGFAFHELNFGKYIPHFKRYNELQAWTNLPFGALGLCQWYGRVNWARLNSPALRSPNQWFMNLVGGGTDPRIFAVAKYEQAGGAPATSDVVLAFTRFVEHGAAHSAAANTFDLRGGSDALWDRLGLDVADLYTVRNLASGDADFLYTNGWPRSGQDLYDNGLYVSLNVGTASSPITNDGEVVQYLKVVALDENTPYDADQDGMYDGWEWAKLDTVTNTAAGDADGDGVNNGDEFVARTDPGDSNSVFTVQQFTGPGGGTQREIEVATEPGRKYRIEYADGPYSNTVSWSSFADTSNGVGSWTETSGVATTFGFIDDETATTTGGPPPDGQRTYRIHVTAP